MKRASHGTKCTESGMEESFAKKTKNKGIAGHIFLARSWNSESNNEIEKYD